MTSAHCLKRRMLCSHVNRGFKGGAAVWLAGAQSAIPKIRFFAALSLLLAVMQVTGSSGIAKVGRGTGVLAPVSRSIPILPRLQKEQT